MSAVRDDQLGRLKELVTSSQRALQMSGKYAEEANGLYKLCKNNCDKLDAAFQKMELINRELHKQFQIISQLVAKMRSSNDSLSSSLEQVLLTENETIKGLNDIFRKLLDKAIDPNIADQKKLFDYVDSESVDSLKVQALQHVKYMKDTHSVSTVILSGIDSQYKKILDYANDPQLKVDHKPSYNTERTSMQLNEINAISSISMTISAHHDRLMHIYNHRDTMYIELTTFEKRDEELPALLSKMYDCLQRVQNVSQQVEKRIIVVNNAYQGIIKVTASLERFGVEVKSRVQELSSLEAAFEEHKVSACLIFEELSNLVTWYELFYTSYDELLHEISRRHKEYRRQQEVVAAYRRELDELHRMELSNREQFQEYHGKYLPPSLCPAILEPPVRYQIYPESFTTSLPSLEVERPSRRTIDNALSRSSGRTSSDSNQDKKL